MRKVISLALLTSLLAAFSWQANAATCESLMITIDNRSDQDLRWTKTAMSKGIKIERNWGELIPAHTKTMIPFSINLSPYLHFIGTREKQINLYLENPNASDIVKLHTELRAHGDGDHNTCTGNASAMFAFANQVQFKMVAFSSGANSQAQFLIANKGGNT